MKSSQQLRCPKVKGWGCRFPDSWHGGWVLQVFGFLGPCGWVRVVGAAHGVRVTSGFREGKLSPTRYLWAGHLTTWEDSHSDEQTGDQLWMICSVLNWEENLAEGVIDRRPNLKETKHDLFSSRENAPTNSPWLGSESLAPPMTWPNHFVWF